LCSREALLRVCGRRFRRKHVRLLLIRIERKKFRTYCDGIALSHRQRFDSSSLVRAHKNKIGLDPTLQCFLAISATAGKSEQPAENEGPQENSKRSHAVFLSPNKIFMCARSSSRTSSGSKRSNSPDQMMATMPGAAINCGKRTRES